MKIKIRRRQSSSLPESYYQIPDAGIMFFNDTGEEIPSFGLFQGHETNNSAENFPTVVVAKKPIDADANPSAIFVNGPNAVGANEFGYAQVGPQYQVLTDGTAAAGDNLGLTDGEFFASPGSGPFVAIGEDDVFPDVFSCLMAAGSASLKYFWPPSGGIPAATSTSSTLSVGSALCYVAVEGSTGSYTKGTTTERVENEVSTIVGASGKPIGCVRNSYGSWTVVVEDCGASTTGGGISDNPVPDAGESFSSRSIDMGYTLGV